MKWAAVVLSLATALSLSVEVYDVTVSERFTSLIERLEGFRAKKYRDTTGHWTIGFGHRIYDDEPELLTDGLVLTWEEGEALLRQDVKQAENAVNHLVKVLLKQEQFDALVSFVFNVGYGNFRDSTLLRKLNLNHCCAVPDEMRRWTDHGNVGKIARRKAEIALYVGDV